MSKKKHNDKHPKDMESAAAGATISSEDYAAQLHLLQVEMVKLQRHFIDCGDRILVLLEGRDASGKDGSIKRIVQYLSPRETRVVALGKPSDRDRSGWYFQRYVAELPVAEELVLFNRSWYNRAGVEKVMGFCTKDQHEEFMQSVPKFEEMLVNSGIKLLKYYLDVGKNEQIQRLADRMRDPLKQWKNSPIDAVAVKHWKAYSQARDEMLLRTHTAIAP
jgi:polyphosphate kinase 2